MVLRQAVDGDSYGDPGQRGPLLRNRNHGAGDNHGVAAPRAQNGQHAAQLAMADQRLTTHQGNLNRVVALDQAQDSVDQIVTAKIAHVGKTRSVTEMRVTIRVATRATERTFPRDLDGE